MNSILTTTPQISIAQQAVVGLIRVYQHTLSPDHGPLLRHTTVGCRFYPSCSEYTARAVLRYGVGRGLWKGVWRILRCTPWTAGGIDDSN